MITSNVSDAICIPNFDQISQFMAVILLLPLPKSKRSPYWNSTSGFHIDLIAAVGMWFYIRLCLNSMIADGLVTPYRFYKTAPIASKIYFRFLVWACLTRKKIQSYWHTKYLNPRPWYYYFRFLKANGHHIEILLPVSILALSLSLACDSALAYQILCKLDYRRRSYNVILTLHDDGYSVANLLPVSGLATSDIISTRYLNPRPRYYFFQFLKTNGHHIEILLSVSIRTCLSNFMQIGCSLTELWRHVDFTRWRP